MYALYKGNTYECSMSHLRGTIKLLSRTPQEGFKQGLSGYVKQVEKGECDRIFRKELCFRYNGNSYLVSMEGDGCYLLETGPRSYDLTEIGFIKKDKDTYVKWVRATDGELYWNETEY